MNDTSNREPTFFRHWRGEVTAETYTEIADYEMRYGGFVEEMRRDFEEFRTAGVLSRALALSEATGQHFNHNEYPQFFTGDLDAPFVLVHLNAKQTDNFAPRYDGSYPLNTFEEYWDACRHFGARMYGPQATREHKSPFDLKQIRFLRPFGVIDFLDGTKGVARYTNLERALDRKLQLELIPYGSDNFKAQGFKPQVLEPHYERIMRVIATRPRSYVIFCGVVFGPLFSRYVTDEHTFRLPKIDGTLDRQTSRFANLALPYDGQIVRAGLAFSWPRQGINMTAYAEAIRDCYSAGDGGSDDA